MPCFYFSADQSERKKYLIATGVAEKITDVSFGGGRRRLSRVTT
jgi:hypothetical protein